MDEQGAEGPEEEGQGRLGDMHVQGGPSPSPPLADVATGVVFNLGSLSPKRKRKAAGEEAEDE